MHPLLIIAAVVYAIVFWALALRRQSIALTLIFASAPMNQDLSGGGPVKFSLAEINLLLALPIVLLQGKRFRPPALLLATTGYIFVLVVCSLLHWRPTTLTVLVQTAIYLVLAVLIFATLPRREGDLRAPFHGFILFSLVLAVAVIVTRNPFVLGMHKNNVGAAIAAGFLITLELAFHSRTWHPRLIYYGLLAALATGLMLTLSRGAWLSAIVGMLVIFSMRRQFGLMARASLVIGVIALGVWQLLPNESKAYATALKRDDWNIRMRYEMMDYALEQFHSNPVVGVGVGLRKEYDATNLVFSTLAESGVVGLSALTLLFLIVAVSLWRTSGRLPRTSFAFSIVAISGALTMGKLAHGMVDHYWVRGTLMAAWSSVGMACWVAREQKRQRRLAMKARHEHAVSELAELPAPAGALS